MPDISRHSLRLSQRFSGVIRQQGRLPLDAEENEAADILTDLVRATVAEVVCEKGTPDHGFRIENPALGADGLDFDIREGSYYIAGVRCTIEPQAITYRGQSDWLTFTLDAPGPTTPTPLQPNRTDLAWLLAWEQPVTAVEDSELLERALGGADSAARKRVIQQVRVRAGVTDDCSVALQELVQAEFSGGQLDAAGCMLESKAKLTVGFTELQPLRDLCRPSAQAGFLGARNETFRIQLTEPGRFIWGRDNSAPLYRVQVQAVSGGMRRRLVFLTPPRDQHSWPLAGMTVELLRWGALLDNGEKVAEPTGELLRVDTSYDPATRSIDVGADVPAGWEGWFATPAGQQAVNPRDDDAQARYFFLRVWTGGGDGAAVDFPMNAGSPVSLGETGLTATFAGGGLRGDYWILSARPNTPTLVTPWLLLDGAPPTGPRRLLAPLSLVRWNGPNPAPKPVDCRHRFRPLCRVGGCCIVTVGDGRESHGDVTSIGAAVELLPEEGGEICIQPGLYREHVVIAGRRNITLTGCGRKTRWVGDEGRAEPLLTILGGENVIVRRLAMTGVAGECVVVGDDQHAEAERIVLEDLALQCSDRGAIAGFDVRRFTVRGCQVQLQELSRSLSDPDVGRVAAVFAAGHELTIERNRIEAIGVHGRLRMPLGGVHIGGPSRLVTIRDNIIVGGNGNGITLGSVSYVRRDTQLARRVPRSGLGPRQRAAKYGAASYHHHGFPFVVDRGGCIGSTGTPDGDIPDDVGWTIESSGRLAIVRIEHNDIADMGYSGIATMVFGGLGSTPDDPDDAIEVSSIEILGNHISNCMTNEIGNTTPLLQLLAGWGGIALSICSDATIRDNVIARNGAIAGDPICGVFIAVAEDVRIERNKIEQNGVSATGDEPMRPGHRGGVVIGIALGGMAGSLLVKRHGATARRPALIVADNTVQAPASRALKAILLGPSLVHDNRLNGEGRSALTSGLAESLVVGGSGGGLLSNRLLSPRAGIDLKDYVLLDLLVSVLGGDAVNLVCLSVAEDLASLGNNLKSRSRPVRLERMTGGEMMVNDNQIGLSRHSSRHGRNLSAVLLLSADDVAYADNQVEVENDVVSSFVGSMVIGATLRATGNRCQERLGGALFSLLTFGFMNNTSLNQTTHCIFAVGLPNGRVVLGNTEILCLRNQDECVCNRFDLVAQSVSARLAITIGLEKK